MVGRSWYSRVSRHCRAVPWLARAAPGFLVHLLHVPRRRDVAVRVSWGGVVATLDGSGGHVSIGLYRFRAWVRSPRLLALASCRAHSPQAFGAGALTDDDLVRCHGPGASGQGPPPMRLRHRAVKARSARIPDLAPVRLSGPSAHRRAPRSGRHLPVSATTHDCASARAASYRVAFETLRYALNSFGASLMTPSSASARKRVE